MWHHRLCLGNSGMEELVKRQMVQGLGLTASKLLSSVSHAQEERATG